MHEHCFYAYHLENNPDHLHIWNEAKNFHYLNLLDVGLNKLPLPSTDDFGSMTETECMTWLSNANFQDVQDIVQLDIRNSCLVDDEQSPRCKEQSNTLILPLSLEDNSTLTGGTACLAEFGKEFRIPCNHNDITLPFDDKIENFSIESARKHHDFLFRVQEHKKEMEVLVEKLTLCEKSLDTDDNTVRIEEDEENEAGENKQFQKVDGKFQKVVDKLSAKIWTAHQSSDPDDLSRLVQYMQLNRDSWEKAANHHGCSILHHAVEEENLTLIKTLLNVGVNPNVKERCGATPLTLAIIKKNEEIVKLLLESYAEYDDKFCTSVPGPRTMAGKLNIPSIEQLFDDLSTDEANCDKVIWDIVEIATVGHKHGIDTPIVFDNDTEDESTQVHTFSYDRSRPRSKTLVVGDQGTNKINRSVRAKSAGAYDWVGEVPGDMHAKGKDCTTNLE